MVYLQETMRQPWRNSSETSVTSLSYLKVLWDSSTFQTWPSEPKNIVPFSRRYRKTRCSSLSTWASSTTRRIMFYSSKCLGSKRLRSSTSSDHKKEVLQRKPNFPWKIFTLTRVSENGTETTRRSVNRCSCSKTLRWYAMRRIRWFSIDTRETQRSSVTQEILPQVTIPTIARSGRQWSTVFMRIDIGIRRFIIIRVTLNSINWRSFAANTNSRESWKTCIKTSKPREESRYLWWLWTVKSSPWWTQSFTQPYFHSTKSSWRENKSWHSSLLERLQWPV